MQSPQVILGPSGLPVWQCDPTTGNTIQAGTAAALDLVLSAEPAPQIPAPGYLKLYSPDGQSLLLLNEAGAGAPVTLGPAYATVAFPSQTVTGTSAAALLATGITVPAGALANGQIYRVVAWGILTTASGNTVTFGLNYGGLSGTGLLNFGAQSPGTQSGAAWRCEWDVQITGAATATIGGFNGPAFSPTTINQNEATGLTSSAAAFAVVVTPSVTTASVTLEGGYCQRVA